MPKFFTARENITDSQIIIDNEDANHIRKVLRLNTGDEITVCDGRGIDYTAVISEIGKNSIVCDIKDSKKCDTEPGVEITLYQGLPKAAKMDYIIQKNTELGICRVVPAKLSRCVVKLEDKSAEEKKIQRWQKIANEAAKQSGRGVIPEIAMPMTVDEIIDAVKDSDLVFVPYECETKTRLRDIVEETPDAKHISFIIGPEGGFDVTEIERFKSAGIKTVTLGKRILRTETAAEAVVSMLMYAYNEI
ncbi:MAG: 16S rRNA (uracil(1498)-N(3))-methyltransferase [Clostridia bacterium]|nr:16S rRNA (uracil(1498)-N(3))-methyltransferase [Clostridia bacterium]MEE0409852.1 16S rRNA (uracil(1498)-N(3))-methyltransferase [Clostridia bacterium]